MFRLLLGGLERLEALDELPPERLERRVPVEAREAAHLEDGVAEVPEQSQRAAVARAGLDLHPLGRWTAMTCFLVGVAFLISNLVPFFGTITGFASAISGTIICWTLPYIFALKVGDLTSFEAASMKALVPVTIIIAVVGVVATVMDMINKIGDQKGAPFGCSSN